MSTFGVISEEKITLWRQLSPGPYCPNDLRRGLLWLQGAFDRRNRHHGVGRPTIKICTAENKEKALPGADVPVRELHHCLQRKGPPARHKKYVSELIILAVLSGYFRRGVVWCVATEGGISVSKLHIWISYLKLFHINREKVQLSRGFIPQSNTKRHIIEVNINDTVVINHGFL